MGAATAINYAASDSLIKAVLTDSPFSDLE